VEDGCGGTLNCGTCPPGQTCGNGTGPGVCHAGACTPLTCKGIGLSCGSWPDGCGGTIHCGTCDPCVHECGVNALPGQCEAVLVSLCTPKTCGEQGIECGPTNDGCGEFLDCGSCPPGLLCGKNHCLPACM
jgi:hypothetical protein